MEPYVIRRRGLAVAGVLLSLFGALALVLASPTSSSAYVLLGQKWSTHNVKYYIDPASASYGTWLGGASAWSGLDASITYATSGYHISARQENRGNTVAWTGVTRKPGTVDSYPAFSGSTWTPGMEVVLNWSLLSNLGYSSKQKKMVARHEFGHALGLGHNSGTIPGSPGIPLALMYPYDNIRITYGIYVPQPDDKAGVNALY